METEIFLAQPETVSSTEQNTDKHAGIPESLSQSAMLIINQH